MSDIKKGKKRKKMKLKKPRKVAYEKLHMYAKHVVVHIYLRKLHSNIALNRSNGTTTGRGRRERMPTIVVTDI